MTLLAAFDYWPILRLSLGFTVIFILVAAAVYGWKRYRDTNAQDILTPEELLTNFSNLRDEGGLTEAEFRTIKTTLAEQATKNVKQ